MVTVEDKGIFHLLLSKRGPLRTKSREGFLAMDKRLGNRREKP